jgi:hypothetical protein
MLDGSSRFEGDDIVCIFKTVFREEGSFANDIIQGIQPIIYRLKTQVRHAHMVGVGINKR